LYLSDFIHKQDEYNKQQELEMSLNVWNAMRDYIVRLVESVDGLKVLVLDESTAEMVSLVLGKREAAAREVYLFERLERLEQRQALPHLKALVFVRPTAQNFALLCRELEEPTLQRYGQYHLFFSNLTRDADLKRLAEADARGRRLVEQVHEYYLDLAALSPELFVLPRGPPGGGGDELAWAHAGQAREQQAALVERCVAGLSACVLALRKKPFLRFQRGSEACQQIAQELARRFADPTLKALFDTQRPDQPVLLVLDRRADPVTPLLHQWTYLAMIHELIGIQANLVRLPADDAGGGSSSSSGGGGAGTTSTAMGGDVSSAGNAANGRVVVLSPEQDSFLAAQAHANFGEVCEAFAQLRREYQAREERLRAMRAAPQEEQLARLREFVESDYAEHARFTQQFAQHARILDALNQEVVRRRLMDVSELEQAIATRDDHMEHLRRLQAMLEDPAHPPLRDKLKLCLLYAVRYESHPANQLPLLTQRLLQLGAPPEQIRLLSSILRYAGHAHRVGELFGQTGLLAYSRSFLRRATSSGIGAGSGEEHNLLAHRPFLCSLLEDLREGRLSAQDFPWVGPAPIVPEQQQPRDIIIFIVGGVTLEEARFVHDLNLQAAAAAAAASTSSVRAGSSSSLQVRVLLGGSCLLNSSLFLRELAKI
jgi:vacuolar protein sorting-associated protein 45